MLVLQTTIAEVQTELPFRDGDIIVRTQKCLSVLRDATLIATFGEPWHIAADGQGQLWAGAVDAGRIRLRRYTSTAKYEDHVNASVAEDVQLHKILCWDGSPYVIYSSPWEETVDGPWTEETKTTGRLGGRWVHVLSLEPSAGSFRRAIPLTDFFGKPEIIMPERKLIDGRPLPKGVRSATLDLVLFDATITPSGTLWLSSQGKITAYRLGGLPAGLLNLLDPGKIEGLGQRTNKVDWWISRHGNGTGIAALSDTEIAVVNGNAPGGVTIVNPLDPRSSVQLSQSVFPNEPPKWGLCPVVDVGDALLVAHRHPEVARIYRVSKTTGAVSTYATAVTALELVRIRK